MLEDASFTPDFKTVAIHHAKMPPTWPNFLSLAYRRLRPKKLTDMTAQVKDWTLGTVEVVSWKSQDGAVDRGRPAQARRLRSVAQISAASQNSRRTDGNLTANPLRPANTPIPCRQFLAKGALVLEPNYRGSAGYGAAFRALNVRNLGVGDMWDVMSGVDYLIAKGIVDPNKLGAMGWSEGGYISSFLTTHTDRFKAISEGAGISDWMTYYVNTDITPFTRQYLHATPWDDPEIYAKTSPITTIKQAKTPTLIQQGSNDKRVPVPDSFELYRGLQDQGVESRMVLYTGFGHGINKPKSLRALLQSNLDWFNHYIWNEPIPEGFADLRLQRVGTFEVRFKPSGDPARVHAQTLKCANTWGRSTDVGNLNYLNAELRGIMTQRRSSSSFSSSRSGRCSPLANSPNTSGPIADTNQS